MRLWRVEVAKEWTVYVVADSGADACRVAEDDAIDDADPTLITAYETEMLEPEDVGQEHLNEIPWGNPDVVQDRTVGQILFVMQDERPPPRCPFTRELPF